MYGDTIENNKELSNAYQVIYDHLEDNNVHALNFLLAWAMGEERHDKHENEIEALYQKLSALTWKVYGEESEARK